MSLVSVAGSVSRFSASAAKSLQSCPTLCDPMDCSLPGSSVHEILQARTLEWVAFPFFRGSSRLGSNLGLLHCRQILLPSEPLGKPHNLIILKDSSVAKRFKQHTLCGKLTLSAGLGLAASNEYQTPVALPATASIFLG